MLRLRAPAAASAALFAAACSGSASSNYVASAPAPPPLAAPPTTPFRAPQIMRGSGVDSVIGARASSLTSRFGAARIDLSEGDARKLQFVSPRCVLDIYLYPLEANAAPVATHVEARERRGGADTDRAGCIDDVERSARSG